MAAKSMENSTKIIKKPSGNTSAVRESVELCPFASAISQLHFPPIVSTLHACMPVYLSYLNHNVYVDMWIKINLNYQCMYFFSVSGSQTKRFRKMKL